MNYLLNEPGGFDVFPQPDKDSSASCVAEQIVRELKDPAMKKPGAAKIRRIDGTDCDYCVSLIGINGSWGSGKSNLLKIVKERLSRGENETKFVFFEYDFWGHREGLTRKMFLEELMDCLSDNNIALNKETKNTLKALTGKTTERETQAKLSIPALFCGTSFVLLPILNLFARICKDEIAISASFLSLVILCVFAITLVWDLCKGRVLSGAFARLMGTFKGKAATCVDFEHEVEPSIGKFTRFLANVAKILKKNGKTLVVVLDNMDRLLPDEVMKCLASVHILFAEKREKWPSNLKVIVPYDATRIGKVFAKAMDTDRQTADDYFRRTFDVVYRLSPQLGSGWETFFDKCYDIVSEGDDMAKAGKNEVRDVLDYLVPVAERTPRKLISILNEVAAIRNTMKNVKCVRMKDIAVYACAWPKCGLDETLLCQDAGEDDSTDDNGKERTKKRGRFISIDDLILEGGFIANSTYREFVYKKEPEAIYSIAAIVYQEDAKEVLLRKWLFDALTNGKAERVGKLSKMLGFETAFHAVLSNDINIGNITNVPVALEGLRDGQQKYWDDFYNVQKDALMALHRGDAVMLQEFERVVLRHISKWGEYAQELRNASKDIGKKSETAVSIESVLKESGRTQVSSVPSKMVPPDEFRAALKYCRYNYNLLNICCDWDELDQYGAGSFGKDKWWEHFNGLRYLSHDVAIRLRKTKCKMECCAIPMEMPLLDIYFGILENITDGVISCNCDRRGCDVYTQWLADPKNFVAYSSSNDRMECRVVALALRFGGFPWNVKEIDEFINKKNGWESVRAEDELFEILDHYFSRPELLKRLQELNRPEPLFQNMLNRLKNECQLSKSAHELLETGM